MTLLSIDYMSHKLKCHAMEKALPPVIPLHKLLLCKTMRISQHAVESPLVSLNGDTNHPHTVTLGQYRTCVKRDHQTFTLTLTLTLTPNPNTNLNAYPNTNSNPNPNTKPNPNPNTNPNLTLTLTLT